MDVKEEDILGAGIGDHWYYRSKAAALDRAVAALLPRRVLDVGAGSGFFSKHLLASGSAGSALVAGFVSRAVGTARLIPSRAPGNQVLRFSASIYACIA